MQCPNCQFENESDARFCNECGNKLEIACPECGKSNQPGSKFCKGCGHDIAQPSEPAPKELSFEEKIEKIQRYLPKGLTEKILSQRDKIEGERKQVTVLFADMEGSTPLMEKLGPEAAYTIMDEVYEILIHKVHEYEGTVNELTGDGIMALFGAPIAIENAPQRAIQSALEIHREITRFNDKKKSEGLPSPLKMRIGIHTGPVVVGTLGNDLRVEFKAVGDTVILASRLESMAEPGTTYITEDTFKLTKGLYRFESLGEKQIKGKEYPVEVYRVIAPSTLSTRFEVNAEKGLTPFVGRGRELELLLDGFERVKAGRGQAFSIVAEAGVGKTRLLYEFSKAVASGDIRFREGRCLSYSQSKAYHPIKEILKAIFDIYEGDDNFTIREKVSKGLRDIQADEGSTLPYILELFRVEESGFNTALSTDELKYQFIEALKRIALKGSEIHPIVMAIEDLHWIDTGSEEVLKSLFDVIAGSRILLIFTYRPEFVHTWGAKTFHSQVMLNRLSNHESLAMVSHLLGDDEVDSALEELILEKTEGVPFYVEEFIKSMLDLKVIEQRSGRYYLSKDEKELAIPSRIQDVIMARVDPLPEGTKEVIQAGSAIGREFGFNLIKRVTDLTEQDLLSNISILKDSELVYEKGVYPNVSYTYKHALTQEVVFKSIISSKRENLHKRIGQAIEALYPGRLDEYYEALAYHYAEGKKLSKAYQYLRLSAEKASRMYAFGEAVGLLNRALQLYEAMSPGETAIKCKLLWDITESLINAGESRHALDVELPMAFSLAESIEDKEIAWRACNLAVRAFIYWQGGSVDVWASEEGIQWVKRADQYAKPNTAERAMTDFLLGIVKYSTGDVKIGSLMMTRAMEQIRNLGDDETIWFTAPLWLVYGSGPQGYEEQLHVAEEMSQRSRQRISLQAATTSLFFIGNTFLQYGQRQRCEELWHECRVIAQRTKQGHSLLTSLSSLAILSTIDGMLDDAIQETNELLSLGREFGLTQFTNNQWLFSGMRANFLLGNTKRLIEALRPPPASQHLRTLYLATLNQNDEAIDILDGILKRRPHIGTLDDYVWYFVDVIYLEAAVLVGHRRAAEALIRQLSGKSPNITAYWYATCVPRHLGAASALLGMPEEARIHYQEAIEVSKKVRFRPELSLTRFQLAELLLEYYPDERGEAIEHLDFAIDEFREMKMQPSLEKAQALKGSL